LYDKFLIIMTSTFNLNLRYIKILHQIGGSDMYLSSMYEAGMGQGDLEKIQILGTDIKECLYKFKPNDLMIKPYGLG